MTGDFNFPLLFADTLTPRQRDALRFLWYSSPAGVRDKFLELWSGTSNSWIGTTLFSPSESAFRVIRYFEGFSRVRYRCPAGVWTIGFGHTRTARSRESVTEQEALELLAQDINEAAMAVRRQVPQLQHQGQFDALVSFVFNIGESQFSRSTLVRLLRDKQPQLAAQQFERWVHGGGKVLPGLVRRRRVERKLFETGVVDFS